MIRVVVLGIIFSIFLSACNNQASNKAEDFVSGNPSEKEAKKEEILYSMNLPTDISELFEKEGANFDPDIPAPVNTLPLYTDPEHIAVMLGVLGVDLSYMKIMDQNTMSGEYYNAIKILAGNLHIPENIFEQSSITLKQNIGNQDSLTRVINFIYSDTDKFLRDNGNNNLAALSLFGGWVEAMYIGAKIYKAQDGNNSMAYNIMQQKFTMNSIYSILSNHQESLRITSYVLMLKRLRNVFNDVEILYPIDGFSVDTTQKKLQSSEVQIHYNPETLENIIQLIIYMREELISTKEEKSTTA